MFYLFGIGGSLELPSPQVGNSANQNHRLIHHIAADGTVFTYTQYNPRGTTKWSFKDLDSIMYNAVCNFLLNNIDREIIIVDHFNYGRRCYIATEDIVVQRDKLIKGCIDGNRESFSFDLEVYNA